MRRLLRDRTDDGTSLVEVLVTLVLLSAVGALVTGAILNSQKIFLIADDENRGLADAKVIVERMTRDIREARGIVCNGGLADPSDSTSADPLCAAHLQVWVDKDSDYLQDATEIITWRLEKSGDHYNVYRIVAENTPSERKTQQASSLIVQVAFVYDTSVAIEDTQFVKLGMQYDALRGAGQEARQISSTVRLRNKGDR